MKVSNSRAFFYRHTNIIDFLSTSFGTVAGIWIFLVSIIMTYEVIMRRIFNSPTAWVLEISLFILMWFVLLGTSYSAKEKKDIIADFFISQLSEPSRLMLGIAANIIVLVFVVVVGYYGYHTFLDAYQNDILSIGLLRYPKWILYVVFPLTMGMLFLQVLRNMLQDIKSLSNLKKSIESFGIAPLIIVFSFLCVIGISIYLMYGIPFAGITLLVFCMLFGGVPVSVALGITGIIGIFANFGDFQSLTMVPVIVERTLHSFILLAIPLYIMGGVILAKCDIGERIFEMMSKFSGSIPGGLAMATILACALVSAMIGVSTAVAGTIGLIAIPQLLANGYTEKLSYGSVTGGALGILIPPSAGLIVYGFLTNTSVATLFAAAVVPAGILVGFFIIYIFIVSIRNGNYQKVSFSWKQKKTAFKEGFLAILAPVIVLGGIYGGIFTPTESAAVFVVYCLITAMVYKQINWKKFIEILRESALLGSSLMMIMIGAMMLTHLIAHLRIPRLLTEWIITSGFSHWEVIACLMVLYLIMGMFIDGLAITVLTIPVIYPLMQTLGIDVIAFGVILMIFVEMALITPPVGLNLFMVQAITMGNLRTISKGNLPFVLMMFLTVIILFAFPGICLWLPDLLAI